MNPGRVQVERADRGCGVELGRQADLTLIGRARGKRFLALAGQHRIVYDANPEAINEEPRISSRKAGRP